MPQFCLLDPALLGAAGHHGDFARNVLDAARQTGCSPVLVGHQRCVIDACGDWPVRRMFRDGLWTHQAGNAGLRLAGYAASALRRAPQRTAMFAARCEGRRDQWRGRRFAADLDRILRELDPGDEDLLFLPNATCAEVLGLAYLLRSSTVARLPTWHLEFRFDLPRGNVTHADDCRASSRLRQSLCELRAGPSGNRVFYYTDTDELTARYSALGAGRFATLPIPVDPQLAPRAYRGTYSSAVSTCRRIGNPPYDTQRTRPLVAAYIGDARVEKGFALLPALIERVWSELVAPGRLRFVIQANCRTGRGERAARAARRTLTRFPSPQVKVRAEPLGTEEYRESLLAADVLILPYLPQEYAARSSGVMSEALAAGIPAIAPAGTWLGARLRDATQSRRREFGRPILAFDRSESANDGCVRSTLAETPIGDVGVVFDDGADGLALALREVVAHYAHYRQTALSFADGWRREHHPRRLVERLLGLSATVARAEKPAA